MIKDMDLEADQSRSRRGRKYEEYDDYDDYDDFDEEEYEEPVYDREEEPVIPEHESPAQMRRRLQKEAEEKKAAENKAKRIYRNRETIAWCKDRGIQLTGPALGRPPKNAEQTRTAKRQEYQDICDRNIVEGEFGTGKRAYGLNRIMAHLPETSFCVIGVALLCMNLTKRLRTLCLGLFADRLRASRSERLQIAIA